MQAKLAAMRLHQVQHSEVSWFSVQPSSLDGTLFTQIVSYFRPYRGISYMYSKTVGHNLVLQWFATKLFACCSTSVLEKSDRPVLYWLCMVREQLNQQQLRCTWCCLTPPGAEKFLLQDLHGQSCIGLAHNQHRRPPWAVMHRSSTQPTQKASMGSHA